MADLNELLDKATFCKPDPYEDLIPIEGLTPTREDLTGAAMRDLIKAVLRGHLDSIQGSEIVTLLCSRFISETG